MKKRSFTGVWLGRRRYGPVHDEQKRLSALRQSGTIGDVVLFVEHEPVITLGRGAHDANVLVSPAALEARGVELITTERGGDVTLHAPGQLVCYPIIDLAPDRRDVRRYVGDLTETMRRLASDFGVEGGTCDRMIGLWVDQRSPGRWPGDRAAARLVKVGAIGVRISRWVTMHGFALNLTTDLSLFDLIVPCGIPGYGVTSIRALTGAAPETRSAARRAMDLIAVVMNAEVGGWEDSSEGRSWPSLRDDEHV